jgi:hypothetical protein
LIIVAYLTLYRFPKTRAVKRNKAVIILRNLQSLHATWKNNPQSTYVANDKTSCHTNPSNVYGDDKNTHSTLTAVEKNWKFIDFFNLTTVNFNQTTVKYQFIKQANPAGVSVNIQI